MEDNQQFEKKQPPKHTKEQVQQFFGIHFNAGIVLLLILVIGATWFVNRLLTNPLTTEIKVTNSIVRRQLDSISELVTQRYVYTGIADIENTRKLFDVDIPLTTHTMHVMYVGIIKMGIGIEKININVDHEAKQISVWLPEPEAFDHYIDVDNLRIIENNNMFNPIKAAEAPQVVSEIKDDEYQAALDNGIAQKAREDAKNLIRSYLESCFTEYTIQIREE